MPGPKRRPTFIAEVDVTFNKGGHSLTLTKDKVEHGVIFIKIEVTSPGPNDISTMALVDKTARFEEEVTEDYREVVWLSEVSRQEVQITH